MPTFKEHKMKNVRPWLAAGLVVTFCAAGVVWAAAAEAPAGAAPGAAPVATAPGVQPVPAAKVSDEAKQAIEGMLAAYAKKEDYQASFELVMSIQVGESNQGGTVKGTVRLTRPNKVYVQLATDAATFSISCNGQQCMAYFSASQKYLGWKAPDSLDSILTNGALGGALKDMVRVTLIPFFSDPYTAFMKGISSAEVGPAEAGKGTHVRLEVQSAELDFYLDPQTLLVTEAHEAAKAQNPRLGEVKITIDLKQQETHVGEPVPAEAFPVTPPQGAKPAASLDDLLMVPPPPALEQMVDFQLPTLAEGKTVKLSDSKGKVIVLDFWATWCGPCRAELPLLESIHKELADKGLVLLAVDFKEPRETVAEFLKQQKLDIPVALDTDGKVANTYQLQALPTIYLIGKDGKVVAHAVGFNPADKDKLRDQIAKLLEAAPAPSATPATGAGAADKPQP
jgi:thiol-disulfide isomerase/thioredoxin